MAKPDNKSEIKKVREKLWNWMITANGQEKWFSMRAEAVEIIKNEAIKIKAQNGYVTYADLILIASFLIISTASALIENHFS